MKYGVIAGNGRFPILALENARKTGDQAIVFAIREEAAPEVEELAHKCYWISLGDLSKLIEICKREGLRQIMMTGQVKHVKIFSSIKPDWRLLKLLAALPGKNTASLIGGVAQILKDEGIELVDSTVLLKTLLASPGVLTKRRPSKAELADIEYGTGIARALASHDIGQAVAISDRACVAAEAMEGTDAMLRRAAGLVNGKALTLVKVSTGRRHLLFDVPVIGLKTIDVMRETGTRAAAIDANRTLILDKELTLAAANEADFTIFSQADYNQAL